MTADGGTSESEPAGTGARPAPGTPDWLIKQPRSPAGPAAGEPAAGPPGYGPRGYRPPGSAAPSTEGKALAALLLAIASYVICPALPALVALVLAKMATRDIEISQGAKTGEGMIAVARILAWVNLVLVAIGIVVILLVVVAVRHSTVA